MKMMRRKLINYYDHNEEENYADYRDIWSLCGKFD